MNKRQKIVQQAFLDDEEKVIKRLKSVYNQSLKDITAKSNALQKDIEKLAAMYEDEEDEAEKARLQSMQRSKVYQKKYQDSLKKQVSDILDNMHENEYETVAAYLDKCYEQGFLGTMYDLQGQGIPLCFPLDQEAMVRAVQLDSKISQGLYKRLGEDVSLLKRKITAQVSRGISTGMTFGQVAQQLAAYTNIGFNNAVRIARTEGHRIQCQSTMDACYKAKDKGADVVKQWDSTLDAKTRDSHVAVDGEIRELDEKFSNGLRYPSDPSGGAAEVVNCRCALLQRARWALDEDELQTLKDRAEYFGIDKGGGFEDFKKKYLKGANEIEKIDDFIADVAKKHGIKIDISEAGGLVEEATAQIEAIDELLTEYKSTMIDYKIVKGGYFDKNGGQCYMLNGKSAVSVKAQTIKRNNTQDRLKLGDNSYLTTTYHEFAHSLSQSREKIDPEFWQDIKKVRTKYRKALKDIDKAEIVDHTISTTDAIKARKKIFISDYADTDIDEFLADAFAQAKLSASPSPYADEVLEVVNKYFKRGSAFIVADAADDIQDVAKAVKKQKKAFVSARTIDEAENYVKDFVDDNVWAGTGVSFKGISVEAANKVNETLSNLYDTFDIDKLGGVFVAKGNTKLGKAVEGATAAYSPVRKSLLLNNRAMKNVDDIAISHAKEVEMIKDYAKNPSAYTFKTKRAEAVAKASIKSGRATVPDTVEDVIHHEMGHHIESVVMKSDDWAAVKANMSKYAENISGYATINESEYISESFASFMKGEGLVDPKLANIFKNLKRSQTSKIIDSVSDSKKYLEKLENSGIIISEKQFGKKVGKHAVDFGLDASLESDRQKMRGIIDDIVTNHDEIRTGSWRGQTELVNFYIKGEDVVLVSSKTNQFISILKGGVTNDRVKNAGK